MNELFRNKYRIPSARARWWDYRQNGLYFVTICTGEREHYFGDIIADEMQLSDIGRIALECWRQIPEYFSFVKLDVFTIMPNHVHGIIIIDKEEDIPFDAENGFSPQLENLAAVIRGYKTGVTARAKHIHADFAWQSRYHDHIIRNHDSYMRIADYITNNHLLWQNDKFHPQASPF